MDLSLWILVSLIRMICGSLCSVCVSSSMPGRLVLIHPAFQVMIFSCDVEYVSSIVVVCGVWVLCGGFMFGWYPMIGRVHLVSSCKICGGMCGISFFKVVIFMASPLAIFVLICV